MCPRKCHSKIRLEEKIITNISKSTAYEFKTLTMLQGNIEIFTAFLKDIGEFLNVGICILIMKPDM